MQRPAWNTPSISRGALSAMKAAHAGSIRSALKVASSTAFAADALRKTAAAIVHRASKNIVFSRAFMTAMHVSITRIPRLLTLKAIFATSRSHYGRLGVVAVMFSSNS